MSLLTALLAFVPAMAAKKAEEKPRGGDLEHALEMLEEMTASRNRAARRVAKLQDENIGLRRVRDQILAMLQERDRVITNLATMLPLPTQIFPFDQAQAGLEYLANAQQNAQALQNQQAQFINARDCTCVPGRADALIGAYRRCD